MEAILLAFAPVVVTFLVQAYKKLRTVQLSANKKNWIRASALVFSFISVILTSWSNGSSIDPILFQEFVKGIAVFAATQIPYMLGKKSGEKALTGEA